MTTAAAHTHTSDGSDAPGPVAVTHLDATFRAVLSGSGVVRTEHALTLVTGEQHPFGNFVVLRGALEPEDVARALDPLVACGAPSAVIFTRTPSADEISIMRASGFEPHGSMPAMTVEIDRLAATSLPEGHALSRIAAGVDSDAWTGAFAVGYGLPRPVAAKFSPDAVGATEDPGAPLQFFAVRKAGGIVSTSMIHLHGGVAGVYCVATIPEERGRGLGAHITAEPLRIARAQGYRTGVLQSTEEGQPVYRRLGFSEVAQVPLFVRMPE